MADSPLGPEARTLFDALRRDESPSALEHRALMARVDLTAAGAVATASTTATVLKAVGLAVALAGAGTAAAMWADRSSTPPDPPGTGQSAAGPAAVDLEIETEPAPAIPKPTPEPMGTRRRTTPGPVDPPARAPTADPTHGRRPKPRPEPQPEPRRVGPDRPPPSTANPAEITPQGQNDAPNDTLDAEVRLLGQIRKALADGDWTRALKLASEHRRRFPGGTFAGEREVLAVRALCARGNRTGAKQRADAFVRRHPTSHLAGKIRTVCVDP